MAANLIPAESVTAAVVNRYADSPAPFDYVVSPRIPPQGRQVEVRVSAASVNPLDLMMARGYGRRLFGLGPGGRFPLQLGRDGTGVVTRVGPKVRHLQPGDVVWFALPPFAKGSYASHIRIGSRQAGSAPRNITSIEAASLPYAGITALRLLDAARLDEASSRGRRVFIHGASGGIGMVLLDLLHAWGASVCVSASPKVFDVLKARGARECFDSRGGDIARGIASCDTLLNLVASGDANLDSERALFAALPPGGRYATPVTPVVGMIDQFGFVCGAIRSWACLRRARKAAKQYGVEYRWALFKADLASLDRLAALVTGGVLLPPPVAVHPFADLQLAHAASQQSPRLGKIVVTMESVD